MHSPPLKRLTLCPIVGAWVALFILGAGPASAMQVTGYTAAQNDRFSTGFPLAPADNSDVSFVGREYDWSGTAWSTQTHAAGSYKGLAMLSPVHFLTAQHYEYSNNNEATTGVRVLGLDGLVHSSSGVAGISNLGRGFLLTNYDNTNYDLAVGTLQQPVTTPTNIFRSAVMDLNSSSSLDSLSNYSSLDLFICGRGSVTSGSPRVGVATPDLVAMFNSDPLQTGIQTTRTQVQLEAGDSGHPVYYGWTNPDGGKELTVLGVNSTTDTDNGFNYISFLPTAGAINAANAAMTPAGYALRVVGSFSNTWVGGAGSTAQKDDLARSGNWTPATTPTDKYALFDPTQTSYRTIDLNANTNLRGLYFKSSAASSDGFSFAGASTLTIGRGGITNYDADPQNFSAAITLGSHQYWDAGPGGLSLTAINTNGKLLEIRTGGTTTISGAVSGSGSLALSAGTLVVSGTSSFTGPTWVHDGTLRVTGSVGSSSSMILDSTATLEGSGQTASIEGSGTVSPGTNQAILTAPSIDPSGGLDFAFEFTSASAPQFATAQASTNDLLRLTGTSPFTSPLSSSSRIAIYLDVTSLEAGQVFRGGFFTDQSADFLASISGASFEIYLADALGTEVFNGKTYSAYSGPLVLAYSTEAQTADFVGGTINGRIFQIAVQPDPTTYDGWAWSAFPEETPAADRLPEADPNGDGITNLLACAFKLDPLATPGDKLPYSVFDGGTSELAFRFRRSKFTTALTYEVYSSPDLSTWTLVNTSPTVIENDPDGDGTVELVEVRIPVDPENARMFARLKVILP